MFIAIVYCNALEHYASTSCVCLSELMELPHVRQLQESSVGLSRGSADVAWLGGARHFCYIYTMFAQFEVWRSSLSTQLVG